MATAPDLARGSQWQPLLTGTGPTWPTPPAGTYRVYYTTGVRLVRRPQARTAQLLVPGAELARVAGRRDAADSASTRPTVTGLQVEFLPAHAAGAGRAVRRRRRHDRAGVLAGRHAEHHGRRRGLDTFAFNTVGTAGALGRRRRPRRTR